MTIRSFLGAATMIATLTTVPVAVAQTVSKKGDAADTKPSDAEVHAAQQTLSIMVSAMNSKQVPGQTKLALFGCLYENPLGKISSARTEVIAKNKQLKADDPTSELIAVAAVCHAPLPKPDAKSDDSDQGGKKPYKGR